MRFTLTLPLPGFFHSVVHHVRQQFHLAPSCVGEDVGIGVYCLLDVGVSQETLHDPDIHLCVNPSGGECVTQTVRGKSADTRLVANPVEDTA